MGVGNCLSYRNNLPYFTTQLLKNYLWLCLDKNHFVLSKWWKLEYPHGGVSRRHMTHVWLADANGYIITFANHKPLW